MSHLSETAHYTRKAIKFGAIGIVLLAVLKIGYGMFITYWKAANPEPPPPPEAKFGRLPKIEFPAQIEPLPPFTYRLQTIEGIPPNLPTVGKVYFVVQTGPNLLAVDRAKERARRIGFESEPERLSATLYRFQGRTSPPSTLEIDVISGVFTLIYPYQNDESILTATNPPNNPQAISLAQNFLSSFGSLPQDLDPNETKINLLRWDGQKLVPAISFSETQFLQLNLFRQKLDDLSILPPNPKRALINFLITSAKEANKKIVEVNYTYQAIERETFSDYPLKTSAQAWQELQAGQGHIANLGNNSGGQITIRRIYFAYFESKKPQQFLQPIFVFEGDNDFYAYVTAIDPSFIQ